MLRKILNIITIFFFLSLIAFLYVISGGIEYLDAIIAIFFAIQMSAILTISYYFVKYLQERENKTR